MMNEMTGMMTTKSDVHPREHVLSKLLELCDVNAVNELAPRDHALVLDVCALVEELARAAATATADTKTGVLSSATTSTVSDSAGASSSNGATTPSVCSTASSSALRAVFSSRLKQPTVFWRRSPLAPTSANCGSQRAPSECEQLASGAARAAVCPAAVVQFAAASTKKTALRQPAIATRIPAVNPQAKTARKTPSIKLTTAMTKRGSSAMPPAPILPLRIATSPASTGASKLRLPAIIVQQATRTKDGKNNKNGKGTCTVPSNVIPVDANVSECIQAQAKAELVIARAVQQLGEALTWSVRVEDREMFINIPKDGQAQMCMTADEMKVALLDVRFVVYDNVLLAQEALREVSAVWIDSPWLRARQENIEQDATRVKNWIVDMTVAINDFVRVEVSDEGSDTPDIEVPVWGHSSQEGEDTSQVDVYTERAKKVISSPAKCSIVRAEHAVGSFICQVVGQLVTSTHPEDDAEAQYDLMKKVTADSCDLSALVTRCNKSIEWYGDENTSDVKEWKSILNKNYTLAIGAIDQKMVDCSRLICKVDDRRDLAADDQLTLVSKEEKYPCEDTFTLDLYRETILDIVSIHVRMTQGSDDPMVMSNAKHAYSLLAEVNVVVDEIAVWADPRFESESDGRPCEKAAYLDLIFWCQQLHEEILERCFCMSESISMRSYNGDYESDDDEDDDDEWLEGYDCGQDEDEEYSEAYDGEEDGHPKFLEEVEMN